MWFPSYLHWRHGDGVLLRDLPRMNVYVMLLLVIAYLLYYIIIILFFLRQGFSVALEPVLELALVDQAGLKLRDPHTSAS